MSIPKIALFSGKNFSQVNVLRDVILEEGGDPVVFDIQLGGEAASDIVISDNKTAWRGVDFSDIMAVHIRCTSPNTYPALPPMLNDVSYNDLRTSYLREQIYQSVTFCFFDYLASRERLVINPLTTAYIDHDSKSQFYEKMRSHGFDVPETLTTNDPDRAIKFISDRGEAVIKPAIGVGSTRVVTPEGLNRPEEIKSCPVMIQSRIEGSTLRVHIVGDTVVLALKIISEGGVDSRTNTRRFDYIELPDSEEEKIVRASRMLGLHFSAWDIIATDDGRHVYLDCNPGPYIMWIGPENVRAVYRQLALYMLTYVKTGSIQKASEKVAPFRRKD